MLVNLVDDRAPLRSMHLCAGVYMYMAMNALLVIHSRLITLINLAKLTISRTPDFIPFGEFMISTIH